MSVLDSAIVNNPLCNNGPNDLASMWQLNLDAAGTTGSPTIVEQDGSNTAFAGEYLTLSPGSDQSMPASLCAPYEPIINCNSGPIGIRVRGANTARDHYFIAGNDPGDPGQKAIAQIAAYPVDPGGTQYNCPSWGYYLNKVFPSYAGGPYTLQGNFAKYANGCGDDMLFGVNMVPTGPWSDEYFAIIKIHLSGTETHGFQIGLGQNATPAYPLPFGSLTGPGKIAHAIVTGGSIQIFQGNPVSLGLEVRDFKAGLDPGWRYLSASSANAPAACATLPCATVPVTAPLYGCNMTGSGRNNAGCPFSWAMKKCLEIKKA